MVTTSGYVLSHGYIHLKMLSDACYFHQSGQQTQSLNSAAVTWSLANQLYGPKGPYFVIPMGLLIGMFPTFVQWLISKASRTLHGELSSIELMLII